MKKQHQPERESLDQSVDLDSIPPDGQQADEPRGKFHCPYCSERWTAALEHDDFADAAESAERRTAWPQASALWTRAAEVCQDVEQRNRYLDAAAKCDRDVEIDKLLADIVKRELRVATLDERKSDSLDFHEVDVWSLRRALRSAYRAGRDATK